MQDLDHRVTELEILLEKEINAVIAFQTQEQKVKTCLSQKDWPGLEISLKGVQDQAFRLQDLEEMRLEVWGFFKEDLKAGDVQDYYKVIALLPSEYRTRLAEVRRRLKVAVVGLKGFTSGLENYVQVAGSLIRLAIQEARPSLKGKIYSQKGEIRHTAAASLVLDRQF